MYIKYTTFIGNEYGVNIGIPNSWCCNDSNEQDTTPAERVRGLEDEDVLQEECVQLSQLEK